MADPHDPASRAAAPVAEADPAAAAAVPGLADLRHHLGEALARLRELPPPAAGRGQLEAVVDDLSRTLERLPADAAAAGMSELFDTEALYRAIFENAAVGIRLSDVRRGAMIVQANPAMHRLLGYPEGELVGKTVFGITHPDDVPENERLYRQVLAGALPSFQMEKRYLRRDGTLMWGRVAVSPLRDEHGEVRYMIGMVEDITGRKRAEEQLQLQATALAQSIARTRAVLDAAVDAIITIDEHGNIESINPATERIFGWTAAELAGKNVKILMPQPYRDEHDGYMERYLRTGERRIIGIGREVSAQRKDGTTFPADLAVAEVPIGGRRLFMGTIRDITARRELEDQLRQALKMEAIGRLAGGVAHDFNNLLASILGYSEQLVDRLGPGGLLHAAQQIRRSAERGAALTRQLLAFSRRQELAPERLDLRAVVLELQDMLGRLLGDQVELAYELEPAVWTVVADPGQLQQVILNLVVNARDAIDDRGRITLGVDNVEMPQEAVRHGASLAAGQWVRLIVRDNGSGMSEEVRSRIFEPFFTTKEPGKGTGLGLSTVYGIVQQSGGSILVESARGVGTTFEIYLPRAEGSVATAAQPEEESTRGGNETVLLVEDDDTFRELIADVLGQAGYQVLVANDPAQALLLAERQTGPLDLLISDVAMPVMRGTELAQRLRETRPALRVLLMSGYSDLDETHAPSPAPPHQGFLGKPFRTRELLRAARRLLDG